MKNVIDENVDTAGGASSVSVGRAVWAWTVAVLCWLAVVVAAFAAVLVYSVVRVEAVLAATDLALELYIRSWVVVAVVGATRFAAGVLWRRGVAGAAWVLVLPGAFYLYDVSTRTSVPMWRNVTFAVVAMAACTAMVVWWAPVERRRRRVGG